MKKSSEESIIKQIKHATEKHARIDQKLIQEEGRLVQDATTIASLKKQKLALKDRLTSLETMLSSMQESPKTSAEVITLPLQERLIAPHPLRRVANA